MATTTEPRHAIRVHIRWMIRRDMAEVLDIEKASFEFSWLKNDFLNCLRQWNCIGMVAEHEDRVVGFMVYELNKTNIRVLNFAVAPDVRRQGIGSEMALHLADKLSPQCRRRLVLNVRESNLPAQLFFRALGFQAVNVVRGMYDETGEDAYTMQYRYRREVSCG